MLWFDVRSARLATIGALLAAGLVLAACGGGASHSAGASPAGSTTTTVGGNGRGGFAALTGFRTCMSGYGITLPTRVRVGGPPNGGPPSSTPGDTRVRGLGGFGGGNLADRFKTPPAGVDETKYATALAACKSKLPTGGNPLNNSAFQAYRSCLQDHGVTLPTTGAAGGLNRNDPKVQAAMKTCQPLLPAGGFARPNTTTTAPGA